MSNPPEVLILNPFIQVPPNKCRDILSRIYFSRKIQLFYIFLIGFCLFDLAWSLAYWSDYPYDQWTLIMNLVLNIIILIDSLLRCYMYGCRNFCNCGENCLEIMVLIMICPDVIFLTIYMSVAYQMSRELEFAALAYGGILIILRPIVFCRRQSRGKPQSIYLPGSVIVPDEPEEVKKCEPSRMDSIEDSMLSFNPRRSMEG